MATCSCRTATVHKGQKSKFPFPLIFVVAPVKRRIVVVVAVVSRLAMPRCAVSRVVIVVHAVVFVERRGHVLRQCTVVRCLVGTGIGDTGSPRFQTVGDVDWGW